MRAQGDERRDLIQEAKSIPWFHAIDFGDFVSPGRFGADRVPNGTLIPVYELIRHVDLKGLHVLDIGTADGVIALGAKAMGAQRVVATDGTPRRPFKIARRLSGLDIEYIGDMQDIQLASRRDEMGRFDVVVMAGFLYHVFAPLTVLAAARALVRPGGLLIIETVYRGGDEPTLMLNTAMDPPLTEQHSTYWVGTRHCIEEMLKLVSFDVLGSASLGQVRPKDSPGRLAVVARAVVPEEVRDRRPQLVRSHEKLSGTPDISFRDLRNENYANTLPYAGERSHVECPIDRIPFAFPFQPQRIEVSTSVE